MHRKVVPKSATGTLRAGRVMVGVAGLNEEAAAVGGLFATLIAVAFGDFRQAPIEAGRRVHHWFLLEHHTRA